NGFDELGYRRLLGGFLENEPRLRIGRNDEKRKAETEPVRRRLIAAVLSRWCDVVVKAAEVIHREEDCRVVPIFALHDLVDVTDRPILPFAYRADVRMLGGEVLIDEPNHVR